MDVRGTEYVTFAELVALLPLRRGLDRPARARRLRRSDRERARPPRRRPRRRAPDREHPARPQRGRARRPRLPAARGPRALRLRGRATGGSRARSSCSSRSRRSARSSGSTAGSRSCRCSTAAAPSCVLAMTGKYGRLLERIAADPLARAARAGCRCAAGRRGWVLARSLAGAAMSGTRIAVVGGGLAGIAAALELRRRRARR